MYARKHNWGICDCRVGIVGQLGLKASWYVGECQAGQVELTLKT